MVAEPSIGVSSVMVTFFAGLMNGLTESAICVSLAGIGINAPLAALIESRAEVAHASSFH